MQGTVSALILITSTVVFSSIVVGYAVEIFEVTLATGNQQLEQLKNLNLNMLNQTINLYNSTISNQVTLSKQTTLLPEDLQLP